MPLPTDKHSVWCIFCGIDLRLILRQHKWSDWHTNSAVRNTSNTRCKITDFVIPAGHKSADTSCQTKSWDKLSYLHTEEASKMAHAPFPAKRTDIFDKWWFDVIGQHSSEYVNLWLLVKKLLLLSHGQATVERGFSFNKEVAVDNLSQETLRARRLVLDHIRNAGWIFGVNIGKQMLLSTSSAWKWCVRFLTDQRKSAQTAEKQMKRKILDEEIQSLKKKRKTAEDDARQLNIEDDRLSLKAQKQRSFTLLECANTQCLSSKDKQDQVIILTSKLYEKEEEQTNIN